MNINIYMYIQGGWCGLGGGGGGALFIKRFQFKKKCALLNVLLFISFFYFGGLK